MKAITLYTTEDARKDIAEKRLTAIEASIKKWEQIVDGLAGISDNICSPCGLCIEYGSDHRGCFDCPLYDSDNGCAEDTSTYIAVTNAVDKAFEAAKAMLDVLKELE